jgi:hypothetical protein
MPENVGAESELRIQSKLLVIDFMKKIMLIEQELILRLPKQEAAIIKERYKGSRFSLRRAQPSRVHGSRLINNMARYRTRGGQGMKNKTPFLHLRSGVLYYKRRNYGYLIFKMRL